MGKRPVTDTPDPNIAALKELIREAHTAIRDLTHLLREIKRTTPLAAQELVDKAMEERVNTEIAKLSQYVDTESARISKQLTSEVVKAREWMMENLELITVTETADGLHAVFGHKEGW